MSKKTINLLKALESSLSTLGVEKTITNINTSLEFNKISLQDFILHIVCEEKKIPLKSLLSSKYYTKSSKKNIQLVSYLLYYQAFLSQQEIADILNKSKASINRYIRDLNILQESINEEKQLKNEISFFENKISEYKKNMY